MHNSDKELLSSYYNIYEDLTPDKNWKTYVAFTKETNSFAPVILKEMDEKRAFIYQALMHMWNPHIANVYAVHPLSSSQIQENNQSETLFVAVTENAGDTSLAKYVKNHGHLDLKTALSICCQICDGLSEFHKQGYVHRDIKPDNIMISTDNPSNPQIKIIDFGGAKEYDSQKNADTTIVGTQGYQAPESLSANTRPQSDIFSIGCVLNFMLTGQEPGIKRYTEIPAIVSIIEKATNEDYSSRYTSVDELKKILRHEMRSNTFDKIPIIRSIPGFRTHTHWKMVIAAFAYISFIYIIGIQILQRLYFEALEYSAFFFLIPLIMFFNLGNLLRFIPQNIRSNNRRFLIFRILVVVASFLIPFIRLALLN